MKESATSRITSMLCDVCAQWRCYPLGVLSLRLVSTKNGAKLCCR